MVTIVRPARLSDVEQAQLILNDAKNLPWLGGFVMQSELEGYFSKGNAEVTDHVVVEVDGKLRAVSRCKGKDAYLEMGLTATHRDFRRHKYGTAMYFMHMTRAALEGRLFAIDQIFSANEVMKKFLPAVGFEGPEVVLRNKVRSFASLEIFRTPLLDPDKDPYMKWLVKGTDLSFKGFVFDFKVHSAYDKTFFEFHEALTDRGRNDEVVRQARNRDLALSAVGSS